MSTEGLGPRAVSTRRRRVVETMIGVILFASAWEIIGRTEALTTAWPPLTEVVATIVDTGQAPRLWRALGVSLGEGSLGALFGVGAALLSALLARVVPLLRRPAERLAVLVEAIPVVALGPLLLVLIPRDNVPVALGASAAYFAAFVVIGASLWRRLPAQRELFAVLGANRIAVLLRLDLPAAIPAILTAVQLSFPAALLGAVIGEWFGSTSGIGPLLINAMQNYDVRMLWAAGVLTALPAGILFGVAGFLSRAATRRFGL